MSVDDDFKPHDSSAPSPSPAPPCSVAANLSRKKALLPQPAKKLVRAKPTLPANFEEDTWAKLKSAISAIFLKQPDPIDSEILYQAVNDLCLHKLGGNLYQRIEKECEAHISEALQSLFGQSPDLVVFLSLVERCWQDLCDQMLLIRGIALYLDRTYVKQTPNVRSLWDMGLQLFRKHLSLSPEVEHKTVTGLLRMIQSERCLHGGSTEVTHLVS
uniref:Cullin N-terminal domain-containing protein n=1 Tax=Quercus lobata TaxID=97700 RepID=A0A7N2MZS3_QUELO